MQTPAIVKSVLFLFVAGAVATAPLPGQTRDPLKWPFEKYSIWNVPLHNNATYVPAEIQPSTRFDPDEDIIILSPDSPAMNVETNTAGWSGADRCPDQGATLFSAPIPQNWIYDKTVWRGNTPNAGAAILRPNGTIIQTQPFAKCNTGFATSRYVWNNPCTLTGECIEGAHGGSGLSAIGGAVRVGELSAGAIRHVIKLNLFGKPNFYHDASGGHRWPATKADGGYNDPNSSNYYGGTNPQMKIGALLAIHKTATLAGLGTGNSLGLETQAGLIVARALQDYGGYTVDNTAWDAYAFITETGPNGSVAGEFKSLYGYDMGVSGGLENSAWGRDLARIYSNLYVITNNAPGNIGGGPTTDANRRASFACEFGAMGSGFMCDAGSGTPPVAVKIMPLGDSKTEGGGGSTHHSWRGYLRAQLMQEGYKIDYVGPRKNTANGDTEPFDQDHAGHGGYTIGPDTQTFCATCETTGLYENLDKWFVSADPDVVLLSVGVNDFFNAANHPQNYAATAPQRYQDLVNKILQLKPNVKIVVGTIEPVRWSQNFGAAGTPLGDLNAKIKEIADASTTDHIYFADIRTRMLEGYSAADFYDDVHLSSQGATKAANAWYDAVKPLLSTPTTVAVSGVSVSPASVRVAVGATSSLTATVAPADATNKNVSWRSGNTAVATVSATGVVTGVATGSAVITVTTEEGGKTATSTVTVAAAGSANLLAANPGFESGTGVSYSHGVYNGIAGWVLNNTAYNSIGVTAGEAYQGNNKLRLVYGGIAETAPANRAAVTAGQSYTLSLAIAKTSNTKTNVQSPIYFRIDWYNSSNALLSSTSSGNLLGGGLSDWAAFTVTGTAPAGAVRAGCFVELVNAPYPNQDAARFHVDEAVLTGTGGGTSEIKIYAAGKTNTETMQLRMNGNVLQTWGNVGGNAATGTFMEYTYTHNSSLANAEVHFTNDSGTNDLRIDRVIVNGTVYQAENAQSFDSWGGSCNPAGEWLYCNGYKKFTSIPSARMAADRGPGEEAGMRVYPVPSRDGTLHVAFTDASVPYEVSILNSHGVEMYHAGKVINKLSLKVAAWNSGIYFVKAIGDAKVITRKIILTK